VGDWMPQSWMTWASCPTLRRVLVDKIKKLEKSETSFEIWRIIVTMEFFG
tara:strand:+ start:502 stop:651 length:150 start_codon:yes stop_codon:yes gene_type:complete